MMKYFALKFDITQDDLSHFADKGPAFVTVGETMLRDTPADGQRPENARLIYVSLAGSEYTMAIMLARFGVPCAYVTRAPDNPYGWMLRDTARSQGVNTDHFVWAPKTELMGRYIYEMGRTPRPNVVWYQRRHSAASKLGPGMVDWSVVLRDCRLLHTSGITFGLAAHSNYACNYLLESFEEAVAAKPPNCLVGLDYNYRATLWGEADCAAVMESILTRYVDILITSVEDMAKHYRIGCGRYSAGEVNHGKAVELTDEDIKAFGQAVIDRFEVKIVAITRRYADNFEQHRWESAAMDSKGNFFRSPAIRSMTLLDRLGGGDTWNAGFYYGLLTAASGYEALKKGVLVGDAATRLKQTLMFDIAYISKEEVQSLLQADAFGGGNRTVR